jgi:hypothetical protein
MACCRLLPSIPTAGAIVDALYKVGIAGQDTIVGINQGWKLSGAIKTAERKLAEKTLVHGGQALMAWAVGNARVEPKGNAPWLAPHPWQRVSFREQLRIREEQRCVPVGQQQAGEQAGVRIARHVLCHP